MDALIAQHDGTYALTFKNYKNIKDEEIESIFSSYGNVTSIRKSSEQTPWVFIRYKQLDEALSAFNGLQGRSDFEIRVATSGRKNQEQGGSDRNNKVDSKDKGKMKGVLSNGVNSSIMLEVSNENVKQHTQQSTEHSIPEDNKGSFSFEFEAEDTKELSNDQLQRLVLLEQLNVLRLKKEKLLHEVALSCDLQKKCRIRNNFMDRSYNGDDDMDPVTSSSQRVSHNRRGNNFSEKSPKEEYFSEDDEIEDAANSFQKMSLPGHKKNMKVDREETGSFKGSCSSPPKISRKPVKMVATGGARPRTSRADDDDDPPKLIRASEYYGAIAQKIPFENGLACRAAFCEVWANHPLREEIELKEVILTNFKRTPSKREVYEICEGVNLLHVSINVTPEKNEPYCRVLVATEDDANKLYELHGVFYNGVPMVVSSLEYILEEYLG